LAEVRTDLKPILDRKMQDNGNNQASWIVLSLFSAFRVTLHSTCRSWVWGWQRMAVVASCRSWWRGRGLRVWIVKNAPTDVSKVTLPLYLVRCVTSQHFVDLRCGHGNYTRWSTWTWHSLIPAYSLRNRVHDSSASRLEGSVQLDEKPICTDLSHGLVGCVESSSSWRPQISHLLYWLLPGGLAQRWHARVRSGGIRCWCDAPAFASTGENHGALGTAGAFAFRV